MASRGLGNSMNEIISKTYSDLTLELEGQALPALIMATGAKAAEQFINFLTAKIRNKNTRMAYLRVWVRFGQWCHDHGVSDLRDVRTLHVSSYIESLTGNMAPSSIKQHRAAISKCFDFLVVAQIVPSNPAAVVTGPKIRLAKGKTPVLSDDDYLDLLESIPQDTLIGKRDRAYIAILAYVWPRVSAAVSRQRRHLSYRSVKGQVRWFLEVSEKGNKENSLFIPRAAVEELIPYLETAGIMGEQDAYLFASFNRQRQLTDRPLDRREALAMIKRRSKKAGLDWRKICNHSFRATGITNYMANGGRLDAAQERANHADSRTTGMYDHSDDKFTIEEAERIRFEREHTKK